MSTDYCPVYSPFFSALGVTCAIVFTSMSTFSLILLVSYSPEQTLAPGLLYLFNLFISLASWLVTRHRSYGTAKSSLGISAASVMRPDLMVRSCIPVVMAGIIAVRSFPSCFAKIFLTQSTKIYGLVVSVVISDNLHPKMPLFTSVIQLGAGLSVGLSGLAAGFAIGIVGDAGVRGTVVQPRLFVGMILILIFAEVLGLYGLIVALILSNKGKVRDVDALCPSF
ncbi:unnamed protein product, partial [Rhizoctonia solani]